MNNARKTIILAGVLAVLTLGSSFADETPQRIAQTKTEVNKVIQEIYWRVKSFDFSVFWENEMSYLQIETPIDLYLKAPQFTYDLKRFPDSTLYTVLDSIDLKGDTCIANLTTFSRGPKGDTTHANARHWLFWEGGRWKKPMSSTIIDNRDYFQKVREAQEAADEEEKRDQGK